MDILNSLLLAHSVLFMLLDHVIRNIVLVQNKVKIYISCVCAEVRFPLRLYVHRLHVCIAYPTYFQIPEYFETVIFGHTHTC